VPVRPRDQDTLSLKHCYWTYEQLVALIYSPCLSLMLNSLGLASEGTGRCFISAFLSSLLKHYYTYF
jgi:hypothetical protein